MRLIDADALSQHFAAMQECVSIRDHMYLMGVLSVIDRAPTIDAVEVVRCMDCKHRGTSYDCPFRRLIFTEAEGYHYEDVTLDDSYCSFGARKEEEHGSD